MEARGAFLRCVVRLADEVRGRRTRATIIVTRVLSVDSPFLCTHTHTHTYHHHTTFSSFHPFHAQSLRARSPYPLRVDEWNSQKPPRSLHVAPR